MNLFKSIMGAAALVAFSGAAQAATVSFTEGNRDQIVGSTVVNASGVDTPGTPPGFDLGTVSNADSIKLYGRVFGKTDFYQFVATDAFSLLWIFDGYSSVGANSVGQNAAAGESGFVATPIDGTPNNAEFTLTNLDTAASVSIDFATNVVQGAAENVFGGRFDAGNYSLVIAGEGPADALYDLQLTTVPLPAGALLLLTAIGGLGVARRRKV